MLDSIVVKFFDISIRLSTVDLEISIISEKGIYHKIAHKNGMKSIFEKYKFCRKKRTIWELPLLGIMETFAKIVKLLGASLKCWLNELLKNGCGE